MIQALSGHRQRGMRKGPVIHSSAVFNDDCSYATMIAHTQPRNSNLSSCCRRPAHPDRSWSRVVSCGEINFWVLSMPLAPRERNQATDPGATLILRMVIFSVAVVIRSRRQLRITQDVLPAIHVSSCHKHSHYGVLAAFCGSLG